MTIAHAEDIEMVRALRDAGLVRACLHGRRAQRAGLAYAGCATETEVTARSGQ